MSTLPSQENQNTFRILNKIRSIFFNTKFVKLIDFFRILFLFQWKKIPETKFLLENMRTTLLNPQSLWKLEILKCIDRKYSGAVGG